LVDARTTQERAYPRRAAIVARRLLDRRTVLKHAHGPKLVDDEWNAPKPGSSLPKQGWAGAFQANDQRDQQQKRRQKKQAESSAEKVDQPLARRIGRLRRLDAHA